MRVCAKFLDYTYNTLLYKFSLLTPKRHVISHEENWNVNIIGTGPTEPWAITTYPSPGFWPNKTGSIKRHCKGDPRIMMFIGLLSEKLYKSGPDLVLKKRETNILKS